MDTKAVDILFSIYIQLLKSIDFNGLISLEKSSTIYRLAENLGVRNDVNINYIEFFNTISFKFKVEYESRLEMRKKLDSKINQLCDSINKICYEIEKQTNKTVLIIVDDLDKLESQYVENTFLESRFLLALPSVKIIYTFPLETYYQSDNIHNKIYISDHYDDFFIPLVNVKNSSGLNIPENMSYLFNMILSRISFELINEDALTYFIDNSGGLLRDIVKFMQSACKIAIIEEKEIIDLEIAWQVVNKYGDDYYRVFDMEKYRYAIEEIARTKEKVGNENLAFFLNHLFVLEYRNGKTWYDVHPCLIRALARRGLWLL
jgi:hypothetical protein